jgi:hypothetical protein
MRNLRPMPQREKPMEPIRLAVERMASAGPLEAMENALRTVPGVISVRTAPSGSEVLVEAVETIEPDDLVKAAQNAGYVVTIVG